MNTIKRSRWLRIVLVGYIFVITYLTSLHFKAVEEEPTIVRYSPDGTIDGEDWSEIDIGTIFGSQIETRGKGLIVVPGHGANPKRTEIIRNNTRYIPFDRFNCVVFVYADINNHTTQNLDLGGCKAVYKKGQWVDFQWMITPAVVKAAGYTTVTLMLDDVLIAPPDLLMDGYEGFMLDRMYYLLETYRLSSISPNVFSSDKAEMYSGLGPINMDYDPPKLSVTPHPNGFKSVGMNEIQIVMFHMTNSGWPCFHALLDPEHNHMGWGHDLCYKKFCNASLGLMDAAVIHFGRPSVYSNLPGTITIHYDTATAQMLEWAARYKKNHPSLSNWPDDGMQIVRRCTL